MSTAPNHGSGCSSKSRSVDVGSGETAVMIARAMATVMTAAKNNSNGDSGCNDDNGGGGSNDNNYSSGSSNRGKHR